MPVCAENSSSTLKELIPEAKDPDQAALRQREQW
jgi:hypothetical protein